MPVFARALKNVIMPVCAGALMAALAACTTPTQLGQGAVQPALQGRVTQERIFKGGPVQTHTFISGSSLTAGQPYTIRGMLTIDGDVPDKTTITVELGRLVINGNVGNDVKLRVNVPVVTHSAFSGCYNNRYGTEFGLGTGFGRNRGIGAGLGYGFGSGFGGGYGGDCTRTVVDGLLYDDPSPALNINGTIGRGIDIATYGSVIINGQAQANPRLLQPYRPR